MLSKIKTALFITMLIFAVPACSSVKTDKELSKALEAITTGCEVELRYGWAKKCKNQELKTFKDLIKKNLETDEGSILALGTLAVSLNSEDAKIRAIAADRLYDNFRDFSKFGKNPKLLPPAVADKLISGIAKTQSYVAFYAARSTAHAAVLTGKQAALFKVLDNHPEKAVTSEVYRSIMQYGRLKAFDLVKEGVKSTDQNIARAAAYAPRSMYKYTDDEKKEICEWAKGVMGNSDDYVSSSAAAILAGKCYGEYIDVVLDEAQKRADAGTLKRPFSSVLTNFTFSCKDSFAGKKKGTDEQCKRKEELKAKITK